MATLVLTASGRSRFDSFSYSFSHSSFIYLSPSFPSFFFHLFSFISFFICSPFLTRYTPLLYYCSILLLRLSCEFFHCIYPIIILTTSVSFIMSQSPNKNSSRSRRGSLKNDIKLKDVAELIRESEERMKSFIKEEIKSVTDRLTQIEANASLMQSECVRLDDELSKIRNVVINQQLLVEDHERKLRANNVIIHNIPEDRVSSESDVLDDDEQKIECLCRSARVDIGANDIVTIHRIGKRQANKVRPIKLTLKNTDLKFKFLNSRRQIMSNEYLTKIFRNRIFINSDNSLLVQKEEQRLRSKLKELKNENPVVATYIRSGKLFHDGRVVDSVDVQKQIF